MPQMPSDSALEDRSDEDLADLCRQGIDSAERELLRRYMQAIYWLPRQAFGADEDVLSDYLLFALEKIRLRDILSKYDPTRGARFSTWFGVILRNLYLDYLRAHPAEPVPQEEVDESFPAPIEPEHEFEHDLMQAMQPRCRTIFKLLLCNSFLLTTDEIGWIAEQSGRSFLETSEAVADLEADLGRREAKLQDRYDKLAKVRWWKQSYEKQLLRLERAADHPHTGAGPELEALRRKLQRRRDEYERLVHELSGTAGIATVPYRDLATLLKMAEGTLASHISRCRSAAADWVHKRRMGEE